MSAVPQFRRPAARRLLRPERRRFQRVKINVLGRFMLTNRNEYPCQVVNMSPGGVALMTPVTGNIGERVIAYLDHIGRIEGVITRYVEGGFAMTVNATERKRDKLASQLTWLANRHELDLPEDRRHDRIMPKDPYSQITLADGKELRCRIVDVSLSGAAVIVDQRPEIGTLVTLGRMRARVVRHFDEGVALEFAAVQSADVINNNL
ncbi:putative glycosyltransferase [Hartmannibacter diazotrophicus]|uniref:Putative glycosyltransferase n=1 Tax=Hartmannibacter diazotrophicus TaxID=1482074 RepID=A0A2C9D5G4_9HYPH|nr:PilZ domain-containing protein [Hartmannibacter diazotrophicus]SON55430.1 putative glycosyltransferase [Hartmannibacter diazotrophicus]